MSIHGGINGLFDMPAADQRVGIVFDDVDVIMKLHPLHAFFNIVWIMDVCRTGFRAQRGIRDGKMVIVVRLASSFVIVRLQQIN